VPEEFGGAALRAMLVQQPMSSDWLARRLSIRGPGWTAVVLRDRRSITAVVEAELHYLWLLVGLPVAGLCFLAGIGLWLGQRSTRRTIAAIRESEERFRLVIASAPEAIVIFDPIRGVFIEANPRAEQLYGASRERLLGSGPLTYSPEFQPDGEASATKAQRFIASAMAGQEPVFPWQHRRPDGSEVPSEVCLVALPWNGQQVIRGSVVDLSERRRQEEVLRRSETLATLGQLAGSVAHDFNNLLGSMSGNGQLIRLRSEDPRVRAYADSIDQAVQQASSLINSLLRLARQGDPDCPEAYDAHAAITVAASLFRRGSNIPTNLQLNSACSQTMGWQALLQNAVLNLLVNARDAMPKGGAIRIVTTQETLTVASAADMKPYIVQPGAMLRIDVIDQGTGMSPEVIARCLEPFFTTKGERG
ncbi:MAG: PAS domain S-box protein, partial [Planctomycetota bacterium]